MKRKINIVLYFKQNCGIIFDRKFPTKNAFWDQKIS